MMVTGAAGIDLIKRHERFCADVYRCPAGKLTIGYGHTGAGVKLKHITKAQGEALLKQDLTTAEAGVNKFVSVALTQNQFDALVSFVFNLGAYKFGKSTLCELVNEGRFYLAAEEFKRWVYAGKDKLPGLVKRRREERELFLSK